MCREKAFQIPAEYCLWSKHSPKIISLFSVHDIFVHYTPVLLMPSLTFTFSNKIPKSNFF